MCTRNHCGICRAGVSLGACIGFFETLEEAFKQRTVGGGIALQRPQLHFVLIERTHARLQPLEAGAQRTDAGIGNTRLVGEALNDLVDFLADLSVKVRKIGFCGNHFGVRR